MFARRLGSKRRWLFTLLAVMSVLPLVLSSFVVDASAAQQCAVRNDWPVYVVQRGDTLAKIASRYGTTYPVLVAANCLPNANRIFAGQQLRVPPGVVATPPPYVPTPSVPIYPSDLAATYQAFEGGFMTWTVLTGQVSVYYYVSGTGDRGTVSVFPPSTLGSLPDNPVFDQPPAGRIRPVFGFGKVWGNFPQVRQGLGWAISSEQGYLMRVYPPGSTTYQFSLPDGRTIYNNANSNWSTSSGFPIPVTPVPTLPPTPVGPVVTTTWSAYQPYENGFMVWENNTGNVVAFYNNGSYSVYRALQYGRLPDNPVPDATPPGRVRPAFGFGKVWGNYSEVRFGLGWATTPEQGYTATFRSSAVGGLSQTCFYLPDGRIVSFALQNGVRFWTFSGSCI
ncbi:MAG: LysM peptidoglycan-binding domain-containing protein [Anaerolineae bacterium]